MLRAIRYVQGWNQAMSRLNRVHRGLSTISSNGDDKEEDRNQVKTKIPEEPLVERPKRRATRRRLFVSAHYQLGDGEVEGYMERHGVKWKASGAHVVLETCPFCHPTKGKRDNIWKCYVERKNGVYFCHRCTAKGTWWALRRKIGGLAEVDVVSLGEKDLNDPQKGPLEKIQASYESARPMIPMSTAPKPRVRDWKDWKKVLMDGRSPVKAMLNGTRGLSDEVIERYGMGAAHFKFLEDDGEWKSHLCYIFPMFDDKGRLVRLKIRSIERKSAMRLEPKGGAWGLFGIQTVPLDAKEVVLTEGEFDAMAVNQATGRPAVSLPNGASSLPVALLPMLERFEKIYLWMDDDVPGQEGMRQFAKKLGMRRCFAVKSSGKAKDANEALLRKIDLEGMLSQASRVPHEGVATFAELRDAVFHEITNPLQVQGTPSTLLPNLNKLLKGHRRGELTIFSGHTGVGKTTLLSQMSLDYCMQGIPTLWGSFEINNVRLAKLLLSQYYTLKTGHAVSKLASDFDSWAEKFESLPMFFMRYYGSNPIDKVLDAMEYANYVHDCTHVLLDNLQFMTAGQGRGFERFEILDHSIDMLRRFATTHNSHVSLVVHPRKEDDSEKIRIASVFGSAKATQEADNLIILQRSETGPMLDVRKNRFDGSIGCFPLRFNSATKLFEDVTARKAMHGEHVARGVMEVAQSSAAARYARMKK